MAGALLSELADGTGELAELELVDVGDVAGTDEVVSELGSLVEEVLVDGDQFHIARTRETVSQQLNLELAGLEQMCD